MADTASPIVFSIAAPLSPASPLSAGTVKQGTQPQQPAASWEIPLGPPATSTLPATSAPPAPLPPGSSINLPTMRATAPPEEQRSTGRRDWGPRIGFPTGLAAGFGIAFGVGFGVGIPWANRQASTYTRQWCAQYPFAYNSVGVYASCYDQWMACSGEGCNPNQVCNPADPAECATYNPPSGGDTFTVLFALMFGIFGTLALGVLGAAAGSAISRRLQQHRANQYERNPV